MRQRILNRFLITAYLSPKDMMQVYRQYKQRIDPLLQDEAQSEEAKTLYLELAEKLRPTGAAMEGVILQRSDEARKFKNLKELLRQLRYRTRPNLFDDTERVKDIQLLIRWNLDDLEDILKSLSRIQDRLQSYQQIEKEFSHGAYKVINNYGFRPEEYAKPLRTLDIASDHVTKAGFGEVVYGVVILGAQRQGRYAGVYYSKEDSIWLNVAANYRYDDIYTLIHELGHRYWYKVLTESQRNAYEDAYMNTTRVLTVAEREQFWDAVEKAAYDPKVARRLLSNELRPLFTAYWNELFKGSVLPTPKNIDTIMGGKERLKKRFVRPTLRSYVFDKSLPKSVTDYGQTNVKEDFAEIFAHYCIDMRLAPDAMERFRAVTGA